MRERRSTGFLVIFNNLNLGTACAGERLRHSVWGQRLLRNGGVSRLSASQTETVVEVPVDCWAVLVAVRLHDLDLGLFSLLGLFRNRGRV